MANTPSSSWPVNSLGEIILQSGTGDTTKVANLPLSQVPHNDTTDKVVVKMPTETMAAATDSLGNITGINSQNKTGSPLPVVLTNEIGWRPFGLANSEGSGAGRTWCMKTICPDATGFDAVRISIRHASTSTDTTHSVIVSVTETAGQVATSLAADINRWRPVVGGVEFSTKDAQEQYGWKSVTWAGASTITPTGTTVNTPVEYFSDWIPLASVPRADGGTFPLIQVRDLVTGAGAASSFAADTVNMNTPTTANGGFIIQSGWTANDFVTTINNLNSANPAGALAGGAPVIGFHFRTRKAGISILAIGDSLTQCAAVPTDLFSSWGLRTAAAISASGTPCGWVNNGFATRAMDVFTVPGVAAVAAWKPTDVIVQGFSPNGPVTGGYSTDAKMRYSLELQSNLTQSQITAARNVGAKIFYTTGIPAYSGVVAGATQDAYRLTYNLKVLTKNRDITPVDFDALVTNGASPARIKTDAIWPGDSGNNVHPNETYVNLEALTLIPLIKAAHGLV